MTNETYFAGEPLRIGNATQLLLDDYMVEDRWRLTRHLNPPLKHFGNPVVMADRPWEEGHAYSPNVIWDAESGRYRMWYVSFSRENYFGAGGPPYFMCYAESDDGFNWQKPLLDVCEFPGLAQTNVVYSGSVDGGRHGGGGRVVKDDADPDPEQRYKMVSLEKRSWRGKMLSCASLACSPDGLHWKIPPDRPPVLDYHSDGSLQLVRDPVRARWLLYCRPRHLFAAWPHSTPGHKNLPCGLEGSRHMSRRIAVMTSEDLVHWSYPRTVLYPDELDLPDYDNCRVFHYGSHFLMFYNAMNGDGDREEDTRLAASPDGVNWERFYSREPFLARGKPGDWDAGQASITSCPVRQGSRLLLYYWGSPRPQKALQNSYATGIAVTDVDRFVAQQAGDEPGFLLTREFVLEGNALRVNTDFEFIDYKDQHLKVEICRHPAPDGHSGFDFSQPYDGFSMYDCDAIRSNSTDMLVTWRGKSELSVLHGKPVYLRFRMRNMGLYSFRVVAE